MTDDIRAKLREVVAQRKALDELRDELIRTGLDQKIRVADLAEDSELSIPRIYQIRDRRR